MLLDMKPIKRPLVELASEIAAFYHQGQMRKNSIDDYIVHPAKVVTLLEQYGIYDEVTLAIAWLHDVLEDTSITYKELQCLFGDVVASGIEHLTRIGDTNQDKESYKQKIASAPDNIKMIKLCDTLDNIRTLECLDPEGIVRKINDTENFYIPMARELCPEIAKDLRYHIDTYKASHPR